MISYKQAIEIIQSSIKPLKVNKSDIHSGYGVLAEDVFATSEIPEFSNSAMDGFALSSVETAEASESKPI